MNDGELGQFRVEAVNMENGSGFISGYGLESIGGYLTNYPLRVKDMYTLLVTPENDYVNEEQRKSITRGKFTIFVSHIMTHKILVTLGPSSLYEDVVKQCAE